MSQYAVIAQPGPYYGVADTAGNYAIKVPAGNYQINAITTVGHHVKDSQVCATTGYLVSLPATNQIVGGKDFGYTYRHCSFLNIDVRRTGSSCAHIRTNSYRVCNLGLAAAQNVVFTIRYSGNIIIPVSSSPAWTIYSAADSLLTFNLGNMPADSCILIQVTDTAACNINSYHWNAKFLFRAQVMPLNECYASDTANNKKEFIEQLFYPMGLSIVKPEEAILQIFPNPTTGKVTISGLRGEEQVLVYSVFGQQIAHLPANGSRELVLDLSAQKTGIYFVLVRGELGSFTRKLIRL